MKGRQLGLIAGLLTAVAVAGLLLWLARTDIADGPATQRTVERPPPADGPNVLIVLWDTVRADRLSVYGHDRNTTPFLTEFAAESRVFERAITPGMWTPPSHASMFTGLPPSQHGVHANYKWLDDHHVTLAEWLTDHGYSSYAWSANPYLSPDTNLLQGFETFEATFSGTWKRAARTATQSKLIAADASSDISPMWKPQPGQQAGGNAHSYKDGGVVGVQAFMKWVKDDREQDRPFFAYVNLMEAHIPRIPSMDSRQALLEPAVIATGLRTNVAQIDLLSYIFGKHEFTEEELFAIRGVYDAALLDLDIITRDLVGQLDHAGLLDDTVVIITSDHGENLGDHHMFGHKYSLFDTLLNVPLVIHYPKGIEPGRVEHPTTNLDLFATILDITNVPLPEHATMSQSLLAPNRQPEPVFAEMVAATPVAIRRVDALHGGIDKDYWLRTFKSVENDGWKLIRATAPPHQLYHLPNDPGEVNNLYDDHVDEAAQLGALIDEWLTRFPQYDPDERSIEDMPRTHDQETKEMLERLGYIEDEDDNAPKREGRIRDRNGDEDE